MLRKIRIALAVVLFVGITLLFLDYFETIPQQDVPHTSLLREFLGGSSFTY